MFPTINDSGANDNASPVSRKSGVVNRVISNDQANPAKSYEKTMTRIMKRHNGHEDKKLFSWENDNVYETAVRPKPDAAGVANKTLDRIIANHGREDDSVVSWENDNKPDFFEPISRPGSDEDHNETLNRIMAKQSKHEDVDYVMGPDKDSVVTPDLGDKSDKEYLKSIDNTTTNILDTLHGMSKMLEDIIEDNSVVTQKAREKEHEAGHGYNHMDPDTLSDALGKALNNDKNKDKQDKEDDLKTKLVKIAKGLEAGATAVVAGQAVKGAGNLLPHNAQEPSGGFDGSQQDPKNKSSNPSRSTGKMPKETHAPPIPGVPIPSTGSGYQKATFIPKKVAGDKAFQNEVTRLARKYNMAEDDLYTVMSFETGGSFSPAQRNKHSSATGLIQFMTQGKTWATAHGYTRESLSRMSRAEQMRVVDQYFHDNHLGRVKNPTLTDAYMTVYKPAAVGKPNYVHARRGSEEYRTNSGFDSNKDGRITSQEISARVAAEGRRLREESQRDHSRGNTIVVVNQNQPTNKAPSQPKTATKPPIPPARSHFWDGWYKYFHVY